MVIKLQCNTIEYEIDGDGDAPDMREAEEKNMVTLRMDCSLKNDLLRIAADQDRSLSKQIIFVLRRFIEEERRKV